MPRRANRELPPKLPKLEAGSVPLYLQLYSYLKGKILEGEYTDGSLLPSEVQLASAFGVSRITAKQALDRLARDKYAVRSRGLGTRVQSAPASAMLSASLESLVTSRMRAGIDPPKVLTFGVKPADARAAAALGLPRGTPIVRAERLCRALAGRRPCYVITAIPLAIARMWSVEDLATNPVMRLLIRSHVPIERAEQRFGTVSADRRAAKNLHVDVGAALLEVERILYTTSDAPIEHAIALYPSGRSRYVVALGGEAI